MQLFLIKHRIYLRCLLVFFIVIASSYVQSLKSQLVDSLFVVDSRIDICRKGDLSIDIDQMSFFKNNEFNSTVQKGYTLPGFWLQLKALYYPLKNLKLEAGVYSIWFWGTTRYPAFAYKEIVKWSGRDYSNNVHVLPYFRTHISLSENLDIILGDIYGGSNHGLIEPLYNPELNLTSDPEAGLQLLYRNKWLKSDFWIDWQSYIYKLDSHQEAFVFGLSNRFLLNSPESKYHIYFPVQGLLQHRGGEIDTTRSEVETIVNASAGAGFRWNTNRKVLKCLNLEYSLVGYVFHTGSIYDLKRGAGHFSKLSVQLDKFNISSSYWYCNYFISMFGSNFYGSVSTKEDGKYFRKPRMLHLNVDYTYPLGKGFVLGANAELYYYLSGTMFSNDNTPNFDPAFGKNSNFSLGIYLRVSPSFLIKKYEQLSSRL
jgi:hypothetical protein